MVCSHSNRKITNTLTLLGKESVGEFWKSHIYKELTEDILSDSYICSPLYFTFTLRNGSINQRAPLNKVTP